MLTLSHHGGQRVRPGARAQTVDSFHQRDRRMPELLDGTYFAIVYRSGSLGTLSLSARSRGADYRGLLHGLLSLVRRRHRQRKAPGLLWRGRTGVELVVRQLLHVVRQLVRASPVAPDAPPQGTEDGPGPWLDALATTPRGCTCWVYTAVKIEMSSAASPTIASPGRGGAPDL